MAVHAGHMVTRPIPEVRQAGVAMVRALFDGMDPGANLNPGKIV